MTSTELSVIKDLALSDMTQLEIGDKYNLDKSKITRIKQQNSQAIADIRSEVVRQYTGMLVRDQEWRLQQREADMAELDKAKGVERYAIKEQIRKNSAEELGQIAPKTNIVIVPVDHQYRTVNIDDV